MIELTSQITQGSLQNIAKSSTSTTSTSAPNGVANSPEPSSAIKLPATISQNVTADGVTTQITVQDKQYQLAVVSALKASQSQNQTVQVLVDISTIKALQQGQTNTSVTLLGQAIQISLPSALQALANQNGVSTQQLNQLAHRDQGYPLGIASADLSKLIFDNGTSIPLGSNIRLPKGNYYASVNQQNGQLILKLAQVQNELQISLAPKASQQPLTPLTQGQIVLTRDEPGQLLSLWVKKLEATPFSDNMATVKSTNELGLNNPLTVSLADKLPFQQNLSHQSSSLNDAIKNNASLIIDRNTSILGIDSVNNDKNALNSTKAQTELAPIDVLQKALSKAGAMPMSTTSLVTEKNNLASQLLKILPSLASMPLTQYADPQQLQSQLASLTHLNLAQTQLQTAPKFTGEAVTTLFQLLLGFKAQSNGKEVSSKLQLHLQQLSRNLQLKIGQHLLSALDKNASLDSLSQLTNSLSVYQQASSDTNQNLVWYFALPYGINQREEQLEGKFEREKDNDNNEKNGWRLQLKFNLSLGPLVINANRKGSQLELTFSANNQRLLDKINQFQTPLTQQMAQVGFTLNTFSTQIATIPPTLLPGDHYLVKTKA
jgi:hypothetical protein